MVSSIPSNKNIFRFIRQLYKTSTVTNTLGRSRTERNGNDEFTSHSHEQEPYYQMRFNVIPRTLHLREGLSLCRGIRQHILSLADRVVFFLNQSKRLVKV